MYALADCNNFFVSCERVFRPDLQDRPVVVLSGCDGCVVSRSNEAKRLGIKMGAPLFQIKELVEREGVVCFSSNFSLYGDLSDRVMSLLGKHSSMLHQYSIDEAFFSLQHVPDAEQKPYAEQLVQEVRRGVGIPISVGIAPTKTLAKVASKYAKQYAGYKGACKISDGMARRKALASFPVSDVWGIGRAAQEKLGKMGIQTALQLADMSGDVVRRLLHLPGWKTWRELNGFDEILFDELPEKQSITQSRTFATGITEQAPIEKYLADFTASCAAKLRRQHSVCQQVVLFVETSRFQTDRPQKHIFQNIVLPVATANTQELVSAVVAAFRAQYVRGYAFKRAGVILLNIMPDTEVQAALFDERDRPRDQRLQKAIDNVNIRFGKNAVKLAMQVGTAKEDALLVKSHMSPRYSTCINDIIVLKC